MFTYAYLFATSSEMCMNLEELFQLIALLPIFKNSISRTLLSSLIVHQLSSQQFLLHH